MEELFRVTMESVDKLSILMVLPPIFAPVLFSAHLGRIAAEMKTVLSNVT